MTTEERRDLSLAAAGLQLRAAGDEAEQRFYGTAMLYGTRAAIGNPKSWGFFEEFAPGAAARSLAEFDQRMLIDHDTYYLVSRVSAGDLTLTDTARGVEVDSALDDELSYVRDFRRNVEKRRITGMSIGFWVREARWEEIEVEEPRPDGKIEVYTADLRVISDIDLMEVSGVTFPAYVDTDADVRAQVGPALVARGDRAAILRRAEHRPELRELLKHLDAGAGPAATVRARQPVAERQQALAARWNLPAA
ncbi:hypothetical protein Val02_81990 [Virgisporangium aliadipatigenens]|uniref:Prohead serine protease domain-containing protein n=1 Tax=Virgisporangium aliadipatigenens TaxID=741659 RepID=A0A8J4DVL7_9ACTN|nr:HK97 family phage prohead protease [Virgisporangium aliadipatigenens]GIJ51313.1 hypothetical protein Val02_81990 [Virgisporangium aliadipatigenens]